MRRVLPLLFGIAALIAAGLALSTPAQAATTAFVAGATAAQEIPANASTGSGVVQVTVDDVTNQVCINASAITGLTGPITADHLHQGAAGANGPIQVNFNAMLVTCVTSTATIVGNILTNPGGFYVNFHTATNPGGEVRGQLGNSAVTTLVSTASGANEVPSNSSTGGGPLTITVNSGSNEVCLTASAITGLSGPLVADHIHQAAAGANGPIVVNFKAQLVTCVIVSSTVVTNILANPPGFYFNLHTQTFPGGEVRGQLALQPTPTTTTTSTSTPTSSSTTTTTAPDGPPASPATPINVAPRFAG